MHPQAAPEGQLDQPGKPDGEHGQRRNSSPVHPHCGLSGSIGRPSTNGKMPVCELAGMRASTSTAGERVMA